ncbi:hypothetical protein [Vampirovibrio chlorellavorus]|uniref:hypothetical protein n=1 Tax=Vampirovibrio chlorellavorus TaxID=758823 RepID=UPI0026EED315|nr:hypothetical protein [Vampirovibrio chlorellavorus]
MRSSSTGTSRDRLHHLYQKLQNHITHDAVVADIMVDVRTLVAQAVAERTEANRRVDRVTEVYGDGWWEAH